MKRIVALALAILLVLGLVVLPASAEAVEATIGAGEACLDAIEIEQFAEEGELETIEVQEYADEEEELESIEIEQYTEEEGGFWGWLKKLWESVLKFFGL